MKRLKSAIAVSVALVLWMGAAWAGGPPDALLSDADLHHQEQAVQNALEFNRTGEAELWKNAATGHWGKVTPTLTYRNAAGQDCRKFQREVIIHNRQAEVRSARCRSAAGIWLSQAAPKPVYASVYQDRHHNHHSHSSPDYRAASIILFYGIGHDRPRRVHRHRRHHRHDRLHRHGKDHRHDRLHRHSRNKSHDRVHRRDRTHRRDRVHVRDRGHRHDRAHVRDRTQRRDRAQVRDRTHRRDRVQRRDRADRRDRTQRRDRADRRGQYW